MIRCGPDPVHVLGVESEIHSGLIRRQTSNIRRHHIYCARRMCSRRIWGASLARRRNDLMVPGALRGSGVQLSCEIIAVRGHAPGAGPRGRCHAAPCRRNRRCRIGRMSDVAVCGGESIGWTAAAEHRRPNADRIEILRVLCKAAEDKFGISRAWESADRISYRFPYHSRRTVAESTCVIPEVSRGSRSSDSAEHHSYMRVGIGNSALDVRRDSLRLSPCQRCEQDRYRAVTSKSYRTSP